MKWKHFTRTFFTTNSSHSQTENSYLETQIPKEEIFLWTQQTHFINVKKLGGKLLGKQKNEIGKKHKYVLCFLI